MCLLPVLLGFVVPAASIGYHFAQTIDFIDLSTLFADCLSTLLLLATVVLFSLGCALLISATHHATPGVITGLVVRWLVVSYMVPATVLAVGGLIVSEQALFFDPRYGDLSSFVALAMTLSARFVCFLLVPLLLGLSLISRRVVETGAALGLTRPQVFWRLQLPQLRGFILLGLLLLVTQALRETAISDVLHPFSFQTLVVRARAYIDIDLLPESSAWLLATALLGLYPLLTIEGLLARRGRARS
jgi:iron(III) transport system permease protein